MAFRTSSIQNYELPVKKDFKQTLPYLISVLQFI